MSRRPSVLPWSKHQILPATNTPSQDCARLLIVPLRLCTLSKLCYHQHADQWQQRMMSTEGYRELELLLNSYNGVQDNKEAHTTQKATLHLLKRTDVCVI